MKRANGTGCVVYWGKKRRRPYSARITVDYDDLGKAIHKYLTNDNGEKYFKKRLEAEEVLLNYNKTRGCIDIDKSEYTFKDVYEEYSIKYFPTKEEIKREKTEHIKARGKLGVSCANNLKAAYKKCSSIYDKVYKTIKKRDFEEIIFKTEGCATVIQSLSNLFRKLDNYAMENDIIIKGYASLIRVTEDMYLSVKREGIPYTYQEIHRIWNYNSTITNNVICDITLCTIYTGARIEELLFTKIKNINLEEGYFIAGLKTSAGKGRIIPIHNDILNIFTKYYNLNKDNEFLFTIDNQKIDYNSQFLGAYKELMSKLKMQHNTHDGRKTLISELDRIGANKVCTNKIVGHKSGNIGEDVYTKKSLEELKYTINLVDYKSKKDNNITYLNIKKFC